MRIAWQIQTQLELIKSEHLSGKYFCRILVPIWYLIIVPGVVLGVSIAVAKATKS